jgi:hypothetical protein
MNHSLPPPPIFILASIQPNYCALHLILIHTKGSSTKKNCRYVQKKQNAIPSYHDGYAFKSRTFWQKHQTIAIQQSIVSNKMEGRKEGEGGGETQTTCPLPKNQLHAQNGTCRKASKRKGKKTKVSILKMQKTNGEPKQRKFCKTHSNTWENHQNHIRHLLPSLHF